MKVNNFIPIWFFALIMINTIHSQSLTLTFTAEHDGTHVPLDSILIENLTQAADTTLYAPDTVLILDITTGTADYLATDDGFSVSQNYPNPIVDKAYFNVNVPEKSDVSITIRDILGRSLVEYDYPLDRGEHTFTFYPGNKRYYLLTVSGKHGAATIKMLNHGNSSVIADNERIEYNNKDIYPLKYTQNTTGGFPFDLGDELKFTGYTFWGSVAIFDIPMSNQTYTFQYTGNSCPGIPLVTDIDGNEYNTVQIGSQCWMVENLKTTTYRNGTAIPNVTTNAWSNLSTGAYVWYDNDVTNKNTYGALYNWYAVMDPSGLCPEGWHVPDNDEWDTLSSIIGGTGSPFGNKLKSCRQVNSPLGEDCATTDHPRWAEHATHYGTDDYGFSGLPGGSRHFLGNFVTLGYLGSFWSSTASTSTYGWLRGLEYNEGHVNVYAFYKKNGYSVRCLKD